MAVWNIFCILRIRIDTVQWHLEDIIRDGKSNPVEALQLKRTIECF